jgi:hypothetical protein
MGNGWASRYTALSRKHMRRGHRYAEMELTEGRKKREMHYLWYGSTAAARCCLVRSKHHLRCTTSHRGDPGQPRPNCGHKVA